MLKGVWCGDRMGFELHSRYSVDERVEIVEFVGTCVQLRAAYDRLCARAAVLEANEGCSQLASDTASWNAVAALANRACAVRDAAAFCADVDVFLG